MTCVWRGIAGKTDVIFGLRNFLNDRHGVNCLAVSSAVHMQYQQVTDRQTERQRAMCVACASCGIRTPLVVQYN